MQRGGERIPIEECARIIGEAREELREWQRLGLLSSDTELLDRSGLERARLVQVAKRRGVPPEHVAQICAEQGDMLEPFVRWALDSRSGTFFSRAELAAESGLAPEVLGRVLAAADLDDEQLVDEEDVRALQLVATALQSGLSLEVLLQMVRVLADASAKISDAVMRLFHLHVHEQFRAQGLRGTELMAATQSVADPMIGLVEPAVLYFHRKSWQRANREDLLLHLMEEWTSPGELVRSVVFVDLSSYTPLTEAMGDAAAAEILDRFGEMVRQAATTCSGQVVKQIGDEFMLVFGAAHDAIAFGIAVQTAAASEDRFPGLRLGANHGPVLFREGDYYGATVNLAARVTSASSRGEFLVTEAVREQLQVGDLDLVGKGVRQLKGVSSPVELFEIRSSVPSAEASFDPVCGMQLTPASIEASLNWSGRAFPFCSQECLRRFVEAPERYAAALNS